MRHFFLAAALCAAAPAYAQTPAVALASSITVENAWARATTALAKAGGVFLTLTETGGPDRLVGASSPVAGVAELHRSVNENGVMRMLPVPELVLETGKTITLKPGSYHIMLIDLTQQLKPGATFPVTLRFEKAAPITITVTVTTAGASGPAHGMQHAHPAPKP